MQEKDIMITINVKVDMHKILNRDGGRLMEANEGNTGTIID